WAIVFTILLIGSFAFVMLDTFVIPKSYQPIVTKASAQSNTDTSSQTTADNTSSDTSSTDVTSTNAGTTDTTTTDTQTTDSSAAEAQSNAVITDNSYEDSNIKISIDTVREYDSNVYIADIQLTDASYLKTALAGNTYGRNIKAATSKIASDNNAIFAINGDFYGFRDYGYVLRNGVLYRDTAGSNDDLVIDNSGDFSIINESEVSANSLDLSSIWQILSFGPTLIKDGQVVVDSNSEVSKAMTSNPRTAIGEISPLHYIIVVSDGRTQESAGLSLLDLAQIFVDKGCTTAYNLDGGGSSTMYFNGKVINVPTDGRSFGEREVSDIVYIGY
ncbi:MAG TPA: phosphodiester glycosidase family protein, partial [Mobilitalea sp.]|nr:phosphodiester glycosidase family protein [Mobilitalea sp.]